MKYQVLKHNKRSIRLMGLYPSMKEALEKMRSLGTRFEGLSYIGNFPRFVNFEKGRIYSIQGSMEVGSSSVVCSLPQKEVEAIEY